MSNPGLLQHQDLYQKQQYSQSQNTRTFGPKPTQVATAKTQYNVLDEYYRYKYKDQEKTYQYTLMQYKFLIYYIFKLIGCIL